VTPKNEDPHPDLSVTARQATRERSAGAEQVAKPRPAWTAFGIASAFFLFEYAARIEPGFAARSLAAFYGLSNRDFGLLASIFFWVYAPMQILVGVLLDRFGARNLLLLGCFTCSLGIFLFVASHSVLIAGIGRGLTGFGASFAFVAALWLVTHWFPPTRFALLSGAVNALGMLGTAASGVALSGAIARDSWRGTFFVTGALGFGLLVIVFLFLRDPPFPASGDDRGVAGHLRKSLRTVLGNGQTWAISIAGMLLYMPISVYGGLWGASELVADHGLSPVTAQLAVSMIFWGMSGGSVAAGWLSDHLGHRKYVLSAGALLMGGAYAAVLYLQGSYLSIAVLLFAAGFFGGFQMLTFVMAKEAHDERFAGTVIAVVNMIGISGALIFQPLVGYIADVTKGNYGLALASIPLSAVLGAAIILFIPDAGLGINRGASCIPSHC